MFISLLDKDLQKKMGKELHYENALGLICLYLGTFPSFIKAIKSSDHLAPICEGRSSVLSKWFYGVLTRFSGNFKRAKKLAYR